uniref:Uncharacterized protein n=1 Tax=Lotus japonicus TaxID=34305 RepID=I3SSZ9_LOTJA|nr:unknown [Lotus japonicus]
MLKVGAGNCVVSLAWDFIPSFLPLGTSQLGPPDRNTASLAARARISAQETTPGHAASTAFFAPSMTKNACKETFGGPSFSALLLPFEFNSTEASHPRMKQSWKCILRSAAGTVLS